MTFDFGKSAYIEVYAYGSLIGGHWIETCIPSFFSKEEREKFAEERRIEKERKMNKRLHQQRRRKRRTLRRQNAVKIIQRWWRVLVYSNIGWVKKQRVGNWNG